MATRLSTARLTGIFYLGLGISGMLGFLVIRNTLYVPDDAAATLANLTERASLAPLGIAADLTMVLTQSLAALWFFRLFRRHDRVAAGSRSREYRRRARAVPRRHSPGQPFTTPSGRRRATRRVRPTSSQTRTTSSTSL